MTSNLTQRPTPVHNKDDSCCYLYWPTSSVGQKPNSHKSALPSLSVCRHVRTAGLCSLIKPLCCSMLTHVCRQTEIWLVNQCRFCSFKCSGPSPLSQHAWKQHSACVCHKSNLLSLIQSGSPLLNHHGEMAAGKKGLFKCLGWEQLIGGARLFNNDWLSCTCVLGSSLYDSKALRRG